MIIEKLSKKGRFVHRSAMESSAESVTSTARCPACHTDMLGSGTVVDQIEDWTWTMAAIITAYLCLTLLAPFLLTISGECPRDPPCCCLPFCLVSRPHYDVSPTIAPLRACFRSQSLSLCPDFLTSSLSPCRCSHSDVVSSLCRYPACYADGEELEVDLGEFMLMGGSWRWAAQMRSHAGKTLCALINLPPH